jgi:hypothetical protein
VFAALVWLLQHWLWAENKSNPGRTMTKIDLASGKVKRPADDDQKHC